MQIGRNPSTKQRPQLRFKRGFASLLALFFGFLLILGQATSSANHHTRDDKVQENSLHLAAGDLFLDSTKPPQSPFESVPLPWEPNPTDKGGETTDNLDDDPDKIFSRAWLKQRIDLAATKRQISQQSLSSANDERVPLFVLHHSWKSFMHELHSFSIES
jgi:hypothetical protein